jgi:hypothetical protein
MAHSSANYWVAMLSDLAAALALLAFGLSRFDGPYAVAGALSYGRKAALFASRAFLGYEGVVHFLLLSREFSLGRLTRVQPDGLRVSGSCDRLQPRKRSR